MSDPRQLAMFDLGPTPAAEPAPIAVDALDATAGELPPLAEPAIAAPPVECCRACGRPLIGGAP
jgi:hypothetical protein